MSLENIANACGGKLFCKQNMRQAIIKGVTLDSRQVEEDGLFIATVGERVDGHKFISQVFEKNAACVISEKTPKEIEAEHGISKEVWGAYILVENSFQALKDIAEFYRRQLDIPVVGITGSVGKTSTKEFIAGVLSQKYKVLKTEGNFNNEVGLPLTLLRIREQHEVAVIEMGISDFGEMHRLSKMARPNICVITNIGQCHLENLGDRAGILKAKTEIFDYMAEDGYVCINGDDDMLVTLKQIKNRDVIRFGLSAGNNIFADEIDNQGLFGSKAIMHIDEDTYPISVPLPGQHMVINAMAAAAVATILHLSLEEIQNGILKVEPVGGRSNIIRRDTMTIIDDCYNANPVSMRSAIDLLHSALGRKVAVLGDMFELGIDSDNMHRGVGTYAVESGVDMLLCVGEHAKNMYEGAKESKKDAQEVYYFQTRDEMLGELGAKTKPGDTILVKASHGMHFEKVVETLRNN